MAVNPTEALKPSISDDAVKAKTDKGWKEWFGILDEAGCRKMTHKEIATFLHDEQGCPGWWCQMITVEYERARGLRVKHQTEGGYQVSVTKTVSVPAEKLFRAWNDAKTRVKWMPKADYKVTKSTPSKSIRIAWGTGKSRISVGFYPKGEAKCQVTVDQMQLEKSADVEKMRAFWSGALKV